MVNRLTTAQSNAAMRWGAPALVTLAALAALTIS